MLGRNGPRPSSRRVNAPSVDVGREAFDVVGSCLRGHEKRSAAQRQPLLQPLAVQWFVTPITIACNPFRSQRGMGLLLRQNSSHRARDAGCHGRGSVPRPRRTPVVRSDNGLDRGAVTSARCVRPVPLPAPVHASGRGDGFHGFGFRRRSNAPDLRDPPVAFGATRGGVALSAGCEPSASGPLRVPEPGLDIYVN